MYGEKKRGKTTLHKSGKRLKKTKTNTNHGGAGGRRQSEMLEGNLQLGIQNTLFLLCLLLSSLSCKNSEVLAPVDLLLCFWLCSCKAFIVFSLWRKDREQRQHCASKNSSCCNSYLSFPALMLDFSPTFFFPFNYTQTQRRVYVQKTFCPCKS